MWNLIISLALIIGLSAGVMFVVFIILYSGAVVVEFIGIIPSIIIAVILGIIASYFVGKIFVKQRMKRMMDNLEHQLENPDPNKAFVVDGKEVDLYGKSVKVTTIRELRKAERTAIKEKIGVKKKLTSKKKATKKHGTKNKS